jgi:peptide-methionine (S)-S-oxide reductase
MRDRGTTNRGSNIMKSYKALVTGLLLATAASPSYAAAAAKPAPAKAAEQTIVFAGGCFWGIQSVFEHTKGVTSAVSGYSGGFVDKPNYEFVSSGRTGHAESVKVMFDPAQVSLDQLLKIFFTVAHDPTQMNRQGPDVGTQYRSMVEYTNDAQKAEVTTFVNQLTKDHAWGGRPIVTQIVPLKNFFPAEAYHQHYAEIHPNEPYIAYNDRPKVENLKKQFPQLYRDIK